MGVPARRPGQRSLLREQLQGDHPVIGTGYRKLEDDDVVQAGDEAACVSTLLSLDNTEGWHEIVPTDDDEEQGLGVYIGRSPGSITDADEMDWAERVFRRKV